MANTPVLSMNALTVTRGDTVLARNVTRDVPARALWLLTGPNGSGKTSFLRALAGLLQPASGAVARTDAHWLAAMPLGLSLETPRQYLTYQAALMGVPFALIADIFSIAPHLDTPLNRLSTGWRQRVKLSRLMLADRPLWLLDEPSDGLDADGEARLVQMIQTHLAHEGACVIATHDPHLWPRAETMAFGDAG